MNKNQLKRYLKTLNLEEKIEELLLELIDKSVEVNQELLNIVAEVLEMQADFYEESANLLQELSETYGDMKEEIEAARLENENEEIEILNKNKEEILHMVHQKLEELKNTSHTM